MRVAKQLSARAVNAITKDGFHSLGGVIGLYLQVRGNSKQYVLRFTYPGSKKRSFFSLGGLAEISLAEARRKAAKLREQLLNGLDPVTDKREREAKARELAQQEAENSFTFRDAAIAWHQMRLERGYFQKRTKTEEIIRRSLELHIFPFIGAIPLKDLKAQDVFNCIMPMWTTTTPMGKYCIYIIGQVWNWAVALGKVSGENPSRLSSALGVLLKSHGTPKRSRNHGSLTPEEIPEFVEALYNRKGMASKALLFSILTASRSYPTRSAKWEDIDFERRMWIVPEADMKVKGKGNFTVYLSDQAIALLKSIPRGSSPYVFVGDTTGAKVDSTTYVRAMEYLVKTRVREGFPKWIDKRQSDKLGREIRITPHGVARASFKTWTRTGDNIRKFYTDAVELCLAHNIDTKYDGAYDRASLEEERRRVMAAWGEYCFSRIEQKSELP